MTHVFQYSAKILGSDDLPCLSARLQLQEISTPDPARSGPSEVQGVVLVLKRRAVFAVELLIPEPMLPNGGVLLHQQRVGDVLLIVPDHHVSLKLPGERKPQQSLQASENRILCEKAALTDTVLLHVLTYLQASRVQCC